MKEKLKDYDQSKVDIFISYLKTLEEEKSNDGKIVNYWVKNITEDQFINAFKKVYETGLFIDGDSVTLTYRKKLVITYDYHAYKNKIIHTYPDTKFDFQIVYEGDLFSFKKESGKVVYSHTMANPFKIDKKIVGGYGIVKNIRGEFIEILTKADIDKMQNTSKMQNIWNAWYDRMVLKSIIKRICSTHFHDITKSIDVIDNETNEPENASIDVLIQDEISNAETVDQIELIYKANISGIENKNAFINLCKERKDELIKKEVEGLK